MVKADGASSLTWGFAGAVAIAAVFYFLQALPRKRYRLRIAFLGLLQEQIKILPCLRAVVFPLGK